MKWSEYPFLRLTTGIVIGVLINNMTKCANSSCYFLLLFSAIFFCICFISFWKHATKFGKKFEGILGLSSFILLGFMASQLNYFTDKPSFSQEELKSSSYYSIFLISNPTKTSKTTKYEAIIDQIKINDTRLEVSEKAIIYLMSEDLSEYRYGDRLFVNGNL